jgi:hypothetical protein
LQGDEAISRPIRLLLPDKPGIAMTEGPGGLAITEEIDELAMTNRPSAS